MSDDKAAGIVDASGVVIEVTKITDDDGPRIVIVGCAECDLWQAVIYETGGDGAADGNSVSLGPGPRDGICDVAEDARFWGRILGLRVQIDESDLEHLMDEVRA